MSSADKLECSLPERIVLVRHGERVDHVDRDYGRTAERPHDAPLTAAGIEMARALGRHLASVHAIDPASVVFLSSPLQRCVQTSHYIGEGMQAAAPIVIEHGLCEGVYWMWKDSCRNPEIRSRRAAAHPVTFDAAHHKANTSPLVVVTSGNGGESGFPVLSPTIRYNSNAKHALDEDVPVNVRCQSAARALFEHPGARAAYAGKTLIAVGHGETTVLWYNALVEKSKRISLSPPYTGFAVLKPTAAGCPVKESDRGASPLCIPASKPFHASHLGVTDPG